MVVENKSRKDGLSFYHFAFLLAVIIIIFYAELITIFNKEDVDDAWMLSLFYNAFVKNLPHETTFGGGVLANLKLFGMTQAFIYSLFLNIVGWTKGNAHLLSSIFIMLSGAVWFFIFRKLHFSIKLSLFTVLLMVWSEPFFREATIARPEALTFFLVSIAFLAFISGWHFPSGVLALIAFENHPMGIIIFIYILSWIVSDLSVFFKVKTAALKKLLFFLGGIIIGSVYYFTLHYSSLSGINIFIQEGIRGFLITALYQYFFVTAKYYRHIADLVFFSACLLIFISKGSFKEQRFILIFLIGILAANFLNPRPNFHYTIYFYPSFLLLSLAALEKIDKMMWGVSFLFVLFLAYYLSIFYRNHDYNFNTYSTRIANIVPADNLPVIGSPNEWFAFKDREFYPATYTGYFNTSAPAFYLIKEDNYRNGYTDVSESVRFKEIIASNYTEKPVERLEIYGETYEVVMMSRITETVSDKQTNVPLENK